MSLQIKIDDEDLRQVRAMLQGVKGTADVVMKRAIDRTMGTVKTTVSRVARETLNIYKRDLDQNIGIRKYDHARNSGAVTIQGASLPVYDFKPQKMLSGVSVQIKKKGPRKVIEGAFISTMKSGHAGVFWREWHKYRVPLKAKQPPWKKLPRKYRLKIHEIFTTSIPEAVGDLVPMTEILADAEVNLHNNLERELNYELSKL
jgi:hypothetical protein